MTKKTKKLILIAMIFIMATQLLACGKKLDASAYVKSALDASFHQEYSEYAEFIDMKEADVEKEKKAEMDSTIRDELAQFGELEDADYDAYYNAISEVYKKAKYTVKEAEEKDNGYVVKVEVTPIDTITKFTEGFQTKLTEAYENEGVIPEGSELVTFMVDYLNECNANASYGESKTVEINVNKGEDGLYTIPEEDLTNIENELISGIL